MSPEEALAGINFGSRDNTRRPMCWDGSKFGGFSDAQPWIKPHSMVQERNLESDLASEKSVFRFYQALLNLRSEKDALTLGDIRFLSRQEDNFLMTLRSFGDQKILTICNFEESREICGEGRLLLSNNPHRTGSESHYGPFEIAIYEI
jgi:glycosidase